ATLFSRFLDRRKIGTSFRTRRLLSGFGGGIRRARWIERRLPAAHLRGSGNASLLTRFTEARLAGAYVHAAGIGGLGETDALARCSRATNGRSGNVPRGGRHGQAAPGDESARYRGRCYLAARSDAEDWLSSQGRAGSGVRS